MSARKGNDAAEKPDNLDQRDCKAVTSPDGIDVGGRLRAIRKTNGLSQRELARRSGVTNGAISLIENNQSSPSIASLKKVLDGIPLSLTEFFHVGSTAESRVFFKPDELVPVTEGALDFRRVACDGGSTLQLMVERYQPGADTGRVMYRHEGEEAGVVISGRVEITVGGERRVLGPWEAYAFSSRNPHRFRNIHDEECVVISACTPPSF